MKRREGIRPLAAAQDDLAQGLIATKRLAYPLKAAIKQFNIWRKDQPRLLIRLNDEAVLRYHSCNVTRAGQKC